MQKVFLTVIIYSCFLTACNNSGDTSNSASETTVDSSMRQAEPSASVAPLDTTSEANGQSLTVPSSPIINQSIQGQPATATAPGMNPPHGQPGHNCGISVGAPLNSAPAAKTTAKVEPGGTTIAPIAAPTGSQLTIPAPTSTTPTKTAPGMNPPHGEPGHECGIPVGSPLKK